MLVVFVQTVKFSLSDLKNLFQISYSLLSCNRELCGNLVNNLLSLVNELSSLLFLEISQGNSVQVGDSINVFIELLEDSIASFRILPCSGAVEAFNVWLEELSSSRSSDLNNVVKVFFLARIKIEWSWLWRWVFS